MQYKQKTNKKLTNKFQMKKLRNLAIVAISATFVFSSCNSYKAKEVKLSNLNDSINYTLGLSNGDGIKSHYMQNDSSENSIKVFIEALDKAFKSEKKTIITT